MRGTPQLMGLERSRGRHTRAGELYRDCLARFSETGLADHQREHPYLLRNLGYVAVAKGHLAAGGGRPALPRGDRRVPTR